MLRRTDTGYSARQHVLAPQLAFDTLAPRRIMEVREPRAMKGRGTLTIPAEAKQLHCCAAFQAAADEYLIRHRSILDVMSKFQESSARVNRAVTKAVTACGCIHIDAAKQTLPPDLTYAEMKERMVTHLQGELCEQCRDVVETELGHTLFYVAAICNLLGLELEDVLNGERRRVAALGMYNLT